MAVKKEIDTAVSKEKKEVQSAAEVNSPPFDIKTTTEKKTDDKQAKAGDSYEPAYSISELLKADLSARPLTIKAALKMAGKKEYTLSEAKKIILDFKKEADR